MFDLKSYSDYFVPEVYEKTIYSATYGKQEQICSKPGAENNG